MLGPALALMLAVTGATPADPAKDAFTVLRKHCAGCHTDGPAARAGLTIVDRDQLIALRRVVVPGRALASELMLMLDSGQMPPGRRPKPNAIERDAVRRWIDAGAPPEAVPRVSGRGEKYVLSALADDAAALTPERRRSARYVSLNHVEPAARPQARAEMERVLGAFVPKEALPVAIDDPPTVYRLDLAASGWDRKPFRIGRADSPLNVFDVILLEYPYGRLPFASPEIGRVVAYLRDADPVRPVPYVRGDWLAAVLANPRLGPEVLALLGKSGPPPAAPPSAVWPTVFKQERAVMELGWQGDPGRLKRALDDVGLQELPLAGDVRRRTWEVRYARLVARLGLGTPIAPIDGLTIDDVVGDGSVTLALTLPKRQYGRGDLLRPNGAVSREAVVRLLHLDSHGEMEVIVERQVLKPGDSQPIGEAFKLGDTSVVGDNTFIGLAVAGGDLPPGDVHVPRKPDKRVRGRYVLRAYRLRPDGTGFEGPDAGRIVRYTAVYEFRR